MPTRLGKIRGSGATAFIHVCENCKEWGCFGVGVSFNKRLLCLFRAKQMSCVFGRMIVK